MHNYRDYNSDLEFRTTYPYGTVARIHIFDLRGLVYTNKLNITGPVHRHKIQLAIKE